ncbi:MAG: universal stress protein [Chloroflexi bacterium]|nr:universal stress protein [Chloroflexota bacterium]
MFKRMLVPLDGSKLAEVVFTYAKELAGRLDIEVILLYVGIPTLNDFVPMHHAYIERAAEIVRRRAQQVQKKTGIKPGSKPIKARGEIAEGYPAEEILRYADKNKVDLLLMATHGRSGLKRWVLGNVADKVLRASKIPVLLVRTGIPEETVYDKWPQTTLLVPLDGSEMAESVLPHVEALAKQRSTKPINVTLLRVCEPPTTPAYYAPELSEVPLNWGEYMEQEIARCKQASAEYLARIEKQFKDKSISVHSEVLVGKASDKIVDYVQKNPFNLVIMTSHGRSGLKRWVYGSVAENILQGVSSPVLLVKPQ